MADFNDIHGQADGKDAGLNKSDLKPNPEDNDDANANFLNKGGNISALKEGGVPPEVRYIGIAISSIMIFCGFFAVLYSAKAYGLVVLLICVGFGVMLAAFGSLGGGRIFNFNLVGGAALAVVLYLLVYNLPIKSSENYVRGRIEQTASLEQVTGGARSNFFVGRPRKGSDFEFIIFEREMNSTQLYFYFVFPDDADVRDLYIGCIDTKIASELVGNTEELILSLEAEGGGRYSLIDNKRAKKIGQTNKTRCENDEPRKNPATEISFLSGLIGSAFAQDAEANGLREAIRSLEAEDAAQRDFARAHIGTLKTAGEFQLVADSWDISSSTYRQDLGRLVGWSEAISRDRRNAVYIAQSLSKPEFQYLVQLTGQGDFTLRQFATEVLHRLLETTSWSGAPSAEKSDELVGAVISGLGDLDFQPVVKTDVAFSSEKRFYNTLISIEFSGCNISADYRGKLSQELGRALTMIKDNNERLKSFHKIREIRDTMAACAK